MSPMTVNRRTFLSVAAGLTIVAPSLSLAQERTAIRVGVTAGPHAQILEAVRPIAAARGLDIRIVEFSDFITPNIALDAGDLDANSYQNQPFLDQQVADRRFRIVSVGLTVNFPMGIYSRRHRRWEDVPAGARIAIQNDPTNGGRTLLLLQDKGVVRLRAGVGFRPTVLDIIENPRNLRFVEIEAAQTPRSLEDVDAAAVNSNFAIPAGLDPTRDALLREEPKGPYVNLIAVRAADRDKP